MACTTEALDMMDFLDSSQLTELDFDFSTPESDNSILIDESQDVLPSRDYITPSRTVRRRARKACIACHKRYSLFL